MLLDKENTPQPDHQRLGWTKGVFTRLCLAAVIDDKDSGPNRHMQKISLLTFCR